MISSITRPSGGWLVRIAPWLAYALTASTVGAILGAVVALVGAVWTPPYVGLAVVAMALAFVEAGAVPVALPSRHWAVPAGWVRGNGFQNAIVWGVCLGPGVLTYMPFATFYAGLLACVVVGHGNGAIGALVGATYGLGRASPALLGSFQSSCSVLADPARLWTMRALSHGALGLLGALLAGVWLARGVSG